MPSPEEYENHTTLLPFTQYAKTEFILIHPPLIEEQQHTLESTKKGV